MWKSSTILLLTVAFSCFSDRSWSFVVPVVLSRTCSQQSTFFSSVYSFAELLFVIVFSSPIALSLSHRPRMTSYKLSIICQNILTAFACGVLVVLVLLFKNRIEEDGSYDSRKDWAFDLCFVVLCISGGFASVLSSCAKVLLAKDMLLHAVKKETKEELIAIGSLRPEDCDIPDEDGEIVTVTYGRNDGIAIEDMEESPSFRRRYDLSLAKANRTFSFIDLSMAVIAPILVGLICDSVFWNSFETSEDTLGSSNISSSNRLLIDTDLLMNTLWAAVFVGGWNLLSCLPETLIPDRVAKKFELEQLFKPQNPLDTEKPDEKQKHHETEDKQVEKNEEKSQPKKQSILTSFYDLFHQSSILALFAFAMLWCTILTPSSSPLVAYLVGTRDFSSLAVSVFAAVSQVIGTIGLAVPPLLIKRKWTASSIAMLGFTIQILLLTVCMISFSIDFSENYESDSMSYSDSVNGNSSFGLALLYLAMTTIALSRFGLWMGDNAMQLILQKTVPLESVSSVNGALQALYSFWSAISLIVSIFTPVSLFLVAVGLSYVVVLSSVIIYSVYFFKNPKKSI